MHCKSYSHFFSKKFQHNCVSLDVNFNESLTNDVVSFGKLGPGLLVAKRFLSESYLLGVGNPVPLALPGFGIEDLAGCGRPVLFGDNPRRFL